MKRRLFLLAVIGFVAAYLGNSFASTNSASVLPETFSLSWTTMREMTTVKWDGNALVFENHVPGTTNVAKIIPSMQAWTNFWKAMDKVQLWDWRDRYVTPNVEDGLAWGIEMGHGTNEALVSGKNGYPKDGSPVKSTENPSELFVAYEKAVQELIGRRIWPDENP